jgi:hypothetical protein
MFSQSSRYAKLPVAELTTPDGRTLRYVTRRIIASPANTTRLLAHKVVQGERLDNVTARHLGDPLLFWAVCDANGAMRPDDLVAEPGTSITIPLPGV